jgi:hypothetical protein
MNIARAVWIDLIGDLKIGHDPYHSRDLKRPYQKI